MSSMNLKKPETWSSSSLGELFLIERGGSPRPIEDYITDSKDGLNWIKIGDTKNVDKYIYKTNEKIRKEGLVKTRMVFEGDFILSNSMSFGRPYIMRTSGCIHDGWLVIRNSKKYISTDFLYHILSSPFVYAQFSNLAKGSTVKNLNIEAVQKVEIYIPPLSEQQRIVAKIEELFSELDKGIETLKTAQQQLKVYRQAVLKYAFEGKLTNNNVKEGELPEGWVVKTISELGKVKGGKRLPKGHDYSDVKTIYPYLRVTDFKNLTIDKKRLKYLKEDTHLAIKNYTISKDDVYISIAGSIGFVGTIPIELDGANLTENAAKITGLSEILNNYLALYLNSGFAQAQISEHTIATTQPKLSLFRIEKIVVNYPISKIDQSSIVQEIESRLSICDKIEESIEQGLQQAEALRQSILKKAFEGKLVPQDPSDEPACVLLERIKAEREKAKPVKKIKTKKVKA